MQYEESEKLELKSSFGEWKEIIKTLAGFANAKGGSIVIGLDDVGQPLGMKIGKGVIEDFANKIKLNTDPVLYPSIDVKTFGLGEIVEIAIASSDNKPVFAFERAYTRVGKTTQKLSTTEVRALREAVLNALVHRDYTDSGNAQIRIFDDRLEIWSPGLLPKAIDIDNVYKDGRSVPRNNLLMRIFHHVELIENWGTGFH